MVALDCDILQKGKVAFGFEAPFDATVVTRLKANGVPIGESSDTSCKLGSDVFGVCRDLAVAEGLFYIRPTYGTVSRYGLVPTASSMDQIGVLCKDPAEGFALLEKIAGHDEKDGAMFSDKNYTYAKSPATVEEIEPVYSDVYESVLRILAYSEISGNYSRYDGIKFGGRAREYKGLDELYTKTRTEGLMPTIKVASVIGCMVLSQEYYTRYYEKAMKIRRLIKESVRFDDYDVLMVSPESHLAVLAGLPSLTFSHKGEGVQLIAGAKNEGALLSAWEAMRA
jgi:Asp-tRNA(Asn)/Glu-tRNA(Gln) amidotransferase A subunit family amidase